jgi:histidyl-tRNA synthetase
MERLPGFRDFYPEPLPHHDVASAETRRHIFDRWRETARRYAFQEYDGPPLEPLELYTLKSGSEIVSQLYNFADKGERAIALRPEMTPTLARMVSAHERSYKKPLKWFAIPQLFRYERQQKGRLREHFQFNADIIGESGPGADAELIALLIDSLRAFGLGSGDFVIRLSSRNVWEDFFRQRDGKDENAYAFYQVIDKLLRETPQESREKLAKLGVKMEDVAMFIHESKPTQQVEAIVNNLTARGMADYIKVDYSIIRGLAYYTGTVFEAFDKKGEFRAIAGGGRYDKLIKLISGGKVDLPALGFGMGDVVLAELLKTRGKLPTPGSGLQYYCLIEDETLRPATLDYIQSLRERGFSVEYPLVAQKPDKQFKRAQELKAASVVKLERNQNGELEVKVKTPSAKDEKNANHPAG